jgi:hypothetical protein
MTSQPLSLLPLATLTVTAMVFATFVAAFLLWILLPKRRHVQGFTYETMKSFAENAPESVTEQINKSRSWWDDLAPPFSMNSLEAIEHDEHLANYNSLGPQLTHFCFLFHGYGGRSEVCFWWCGDFVAGCHHVFVSPLITMFWACRI